MKNCTLFLSCCLLFVGVAFAQKNKACDDETKKAKTTLERCKKMKDKKSSAYTQCATEYKQAKAKAEQVCKVGSSSDLQDAVEKWRSLSEKNHCRTKEASKNQNCQTILGSLGQELFKLENIKFTQVQVAFDSLVGWCADRDNDTKRYPQCSKTRDVPRPDYKEALPVLLDYVKYFPNGPSAPNMLFQASFILEMKNDLAQALKLRQQLVTKYPNHTLAPGAWLRIGEYYYNNSKWTEAIKSYEKITTNNTIDKKEGAYAMYHLAEAYYNKAEYEIAAQKFWEYIDGADKGKYIKDLRVEAMDYMATAFSDLDDGIKAADKFIKSKKVPYKDSLYFRVGMKAKDHDRHDQAIQAFDFLLKANPNYIDAPLADLAIVEIYILQQKPDKAQEQRYSVVKRYDRSSSWYKANSRYPESVQNAERAIRSAMLDIPTYIHAQAADMYKKGDTDGAKKEYAKAVKSYNDFLNRYKKEPDWHEYKVHMNLAVVYNELAQHENVAKEFNWMVDTDTTRYGRRPQNFGTLITKDEAGYNAVLAMDAARELAIKNKANNDTLKAYNLPETKAYFAQVDRYMSKFGKNKEAAELAYNAAVVHYNAKQYKTAIGVLRELTVNFPKHQYTLNIRRMLAQSFLEDDQLDEAQKEFEWLYVQYTSKTGLGVRDSNATTAAKEIENSIAAVLYQRAEKAVKAGQFKVGGDAYIALIKRFPAAEFSDKALFEAGNAYEQGNLNTMAAETFMRMPREYSKSPLTIRSIVRAAVAYKKDGKYTEAAKAYLFITDNFPQDSMAINAIFAAAQTYDSIPTKDSVGIRANKKLSAQTYEIAFKKFPKHDKTPSLLYNACLAYDDARETKEAIRCNRDLVREYPKSSYALDAAYSIPVAYENAKDWKNALIEYENFIKNYQSDKEKLINAYTKTGRAYLEVKDTAKSIAAFKNTIATYDKYGIQLKNSDPSFAAEAAFMQGEFEHAKMKPIKVKGNDKQKVDLVKSLMTILQNSTKFYAKSAEYASEKWTFAAKNRIAQLFVTVSAKVREQEIDQKNKEKAFVDRIVIVQQLPSYYESARPLFQANIDLAREQGYYNPDVVSAEEGYIEMFYRDCSTFDEVGNAFAAAPLPDSVAIYKEYLAEGMVKDDAIYAVHEDLEAYREELQTKSQTAKQGALPRCASGIKASAHYGIHNKWTDSLFTLVKTIDAENEILSTDITKFDPSTLFRDDNYNKTKARLAQLKTSDLTKQEQMKTYKEIATDAKTRNAELKKELAQLRAKLGSSEPALEPEEED